MNNSKDIFGANHNVIKFATEEQVKTNVYDVSYLRKGSPRSSFREPFFYAASYTECVKAVFAKYPDAHDVKIKLTEKGVMVAKSVLR